MDKVQIKTSLSSGPGGQNVNKVATKVDVRFHLDSADWLSDQVKAKVRAKYGNQLTKDGFFVVKSDRTRSQTMNRSDAFLKLRNAISLALQPEKPPVDEETKERIRKGKVKASRERLREKRTRSDIKNSRRGLE